MDETTWQKEWLIEYRKKQNSVIWITCLLAIFSAQLPDLKQKKTEEPVFSWWIAQTIQITLQTFFV